MARFKVVLTVICEDSVSPNVVGPRFRRGTPMPMEQLYEERRGYWFGLDEEELARECADRFEKYLSQSEQKKKRTK